MSEIKKNSIHRLKITDMNNLGAGIARLTPPENSNGELSEKPIVVFVQGGVTGDLADVKIIKTAKNYLVGRIETLVEPSEFRVDPGCPVSKRCGGCVYRNVTYEHELECKRRAVENEMRKNHIEVEVEPPLHGSPDGYRNKAQYPVGRTKDGRIAIGFYAQRTHEIIDLPTNCRLQPEVFGRITEFLRDFLEKNRIEPYDELTGQGIVRHLYLRRSESTGKVMVCIVAARRFRKIEQFAAEITEKIPETGSVWLNLNERNTNVVLGESFEQIAGEELCDELCGKKFTISPGSFWQVNRRMAEVLYTEAGRLANIKKGERVLDLFCGIGSVGQAICPVGTKLTGIEIVPAAVENARKNALANGFPDAEYICLDAGDSESVEREIRRIGARVDVILLDPPRGGCDRKLLEILSEYTPARVVYISCGPDTLARDLAVMRGLGYEIGAVKTVDLFPRTGHIESLVLLNPN